MINCSTPGPVIKTVKLWVVLLFCLTTPLVAFAESSIQGDVINAPAKIESASNMSVGNDNQANQSAIIIKNSSIRGTLTNSSGGNSKVNMAIGTDNKADQGSVRIENSKIRGTVTNTSTMQKSANMAVGNSNSASQAAIVMGGAQLRGIAVNNATGNATGENAINVAVGNRNEANQSSIVVDGDQAGNVSSVTMPQNNFHTASGGTGQGERSTLAYTGGKRAQDREEQKAAQHVPGQVVFLVDNDKAGLAGLDRVAKKYHLEVDEKTVLKSLNRIMVVSSTAKDAAEIAKALKNESGIYNSQPNYVFATMGRQDPLSSMQNLVSLLDLHEVHRRSVERISPWLLLTPG